MEERLFEIYNKLNKTHEFFLEKYDDFEKEEERINSSSDSSLVDKELNDLAGKFYNLAGLMEKLNSIATLLSRELDRSNLGFDIDYSLFEKEDIVVLSNEELEKKYLS